MHTYRVHLTNGKDVFVDADYFHEPVYPGRNAYQFYVGKTEENWLGIPKTSGERVARFVVGTVDYIVRADADCENS